MASDTTKSLQIEVSTSKDILTKTEGVVKLYEWRQYSSCDLFL